MGENAKFGGPFFRLSLGSGLPPPPQGEGKPDPPKNPLPRANLNKRELLLLPPGPTQT